MATATWTEVYNMKLIFNKTLVLMARDSLTFVRRHGLLWLLVPRITANPKS